MVKRAPRILLCGAGTGGHLYPGLATALELRRRHPEAMLLFAGTGRGQELEAVQRAGLTHARIRSAGLKGKTPGALLRGLLTLPLSAWDAWRLLSRTRPDLVIGLGGYSSGAPVLLAALRRTPTMVLEQNAAPGVTNRLLARVVSAAAVSHDGALPHFPGSGFVSGNPVREAFLAPAPPRPTAGGGHLLVLGGSQGAHALNVTLMDAAPRLAAARPPIGVTHQTGARDAAAVRRRYAEAGLTARVEPFFEEMAELMRDADVILARAGATTLAEIAAVGRPAVRVPLPGAADDHQRWNAEALVAAGAAELLPQAALTGELVAARVLRLIADDARRLEMSAAARRLARPDAAAAIADRAEQLMGS